MTCYFCGDPITDHKPWPIRIYHGDEEAFFCNKAGCIIKAYKLPTRITALSKRSARLRAMYNMTHNDYLTMLANQGGGCAICGQPPANGMHLAVDHDHATGAIRGLLCTRCNLQLGWYELNRRAVMAYLRRYRVVPVR